ncbi:hypothetical protein A3860_34590 [Niastella vici]|uniref:Type IV toxin-antitoxin system AbiEi family antitoxin domain-containing protein n=1 Tax=Niastella vici TaxID=1703345 RepID=A0A1V9FPI2_9BACT|nr:DUF6088 family protein [Niastella vici]OQP60207.1 hypothetical protein A3860_34590 [Niastella vici]
MAASIQLQILRAIARKRKSDLIFPGDFKKIGTQNVIKTTLHRLYKENKIERIAQGIYIIPGYDPVLDKILPSLDEIAHAIVHRDKTRIMPSGAHAYINWDFQHRFLPNWFT